jgi:uncharacterized membrane protein YhhN
VTRDTVFPLAYFLVLVVHIFAGEQDQGMIANSTKPAILGVLIVYFSVTLLKNERKGSFGILILTGLIFSLIGDVLLIFQEKIPVCFMLGLGSFLIAHILFIAAFTKTYLINHEIKFLQKYGWVMLLIVAYAWFFFDAVKASLGSMMGPVLIYIMVISLMLLIALNRFRKVSATSFAWITAGAFFFVASDSLLAWNKFVRELDHSHLLIMITYGLAQYGIARGAASQLRDVSSKSISTQPEAIG